MLPLTGSFNSFPLSQMVLLMLHILRFDFRTPLKRVPCPLVGLTYLVIADLIKEPKDVTMSLAVPCLGSNHQINEIESNI